MPRPEKCAGILRLPPTSDPIPRTEPPAADQEDHWSFLKSSHHKMSDMIFVKLFTLADF